MTYDVHPPRLPSSGLISCSKRAVDALRVAFIQTDWPFAAKGVRPLLCHTLFSGEWNLSSAYEAAELITRAIARLTTEQAALEQELQTEAGRALEDWLLVEACKDYDTIELEPAITGKSHRKHFKALREQKRNTEKMIVALQALREIAGTPEGEKLLKKFAAEQEKYQL